MPEDRSLFDEDVAAHKLAASLGFILERRYRRIEITDEQAVLAAGYGSAKPRPDFGRISQALDAGLSVEGARWRGMEYVLRPVGVAE